MKIFLSWSGTRSEAAAQAFREWLPDLINAVDPWMSSADIGAGARWNAAIQRELQESRFGLIFVTPSNTVAPWLLFEAGALAKTVDDTHVCPILIGLKATDLPGGPLSQFQAKASDREEIWQLVQTINRAIDSGAMPESRLERAFEKWWPDLADKLDALPPDEYELSSHRSPEEMIEEILTITRGLERGQSAISVHLGITGRANERLERYIYEQGMPEDMASFLRRYDAAVGLVGHSIVPEQEDERDTKTDREE